MSRLSELVEQHRPLLLILAAVLLIALVAGLVQEPVLERITTILFINLIIVLGLQMFMGNSGYLSFAHVAFMGIGAYGSALLTIPASDKAWVLPDLPPFLADLEMGFVPGILVAAAFAALFAATVGYPLMRLSEAAAAISSFALLVIVHVVLSQWSSVTNGPRTLFGLLPYTDLATAVMWAVLVCIGVWLFKGSRLGLQLRASRDNIHAASAVGINVVLVRWIAFWLSAFVCALGGALWAHFITSFSPGAFYMSQTFVLLTMLIVGGVATVTGATLGVIVVTLVHEGLRYVENAANLSGSWPFQVVGLTEIVLAVTLIVMLAVRPGGLAKSRELGSRRPPRGRPAPSPSRTATSTPSKETTP